MTGRKRGMLFGIRIELDNDSKADREKVQRHA